MSRSSENLTAFRKQRPRYELNAVGSLCSGLLDDLEEYIRFSSGAVDKEIQRISDLVKKDTEGMTEEEKGEYLEWRSEDYWLVETTMRQLANRSIVVMIHSSLESIYSSYAHLLKRNLNIKIELNDIKGQGINQLKRYFRKVLGIDLTEQTALWQKLNALRLIRNDIVHNQSRAYTLVDADKWKKVWTDSDQNIAHEVLEENQCIAAIKESYIKTLVRDKVFTIRSAGPHPVELMIMPEALPRFLSHAREMRSWLHSTAEEVIKEIMAKTVQ